MTKLAQKNFFAADEVRQPTEKVSIHVVEMDGQFFQKVTVQPGWRWTVDMKPIFRTETCESDHLLYVLLGHLTFRMDDGEEKVYGPGDIAHIPPGHDSWVIGDNPAIWLEIPH